MEPLSRLHKRHSALDQTQQAHKGVDDLPPGKAELCVPVRIIGLTIAAPFIDVFTRVKRQNWRQGVRALAAHGLARLTMGEHMKRPKRNRIQRAFERGYQLGLAGRPSENCPFLTGLARMRWLEGWQEGRNDWREGLTDALTCYKLSGF